MNKEPKDITKKIQAAYATYSAYVTREIIDLLRFSEILPKLKVTISYPTEGKAIFRAEKLGIIGEVELDTSELAKRSNYPKVIDITPSSKLLQTEASMYLRKQKDNIIYLDPSEGIEICTRGSLIHKNVTQAIQGKIEPSINLDELRSLLAWLLSSTNCSAGLLETLHREMERESRFDKTAANRPSYRDSLIKVDKITRALRFATMVCDASWHDINDRLSGTSNTCLRDYLLIADRDYAAADKLFGRTAHARIRRRLPLVAETLELYEEVHGNHTPYR